MARGGFLEFVVYSCGQHREGLGEELSDAKTRLLKMRNVVPHDLDGDTG